MRYNIHYKELIPILNCFWTDNYVENAMLAIKSKDLVKYVYSLTLDIYNLPLSKKEINAVAFRSAYVLEHLLQSDNELRQSLKPKIFRDFPAVKNESAKRHFCNIMLTFLKDDYPAKNEAEAIVEACMEWIEQPGTKVAVIVNAMDVILKLKDYVLIDKETLSDLIFLIRKNSTPGITCRIKKWERLYGEFY